MKSCEDLGFLLRQLELTEIWRHSEISLRCPFFALSEAPSRRKWSGRARCAVEVDIGVFRSALERDRELDTGRPLALAPREMAADGETSSENTPITVRPAVRVYEQGSYPMEHYSSPSLGHGAQRQPIASFVSEVPASAFQTPLSSCGNGAILTGEKSFSYPQWTPCAPGVRHVPYSNTDVVIEPAQVQWTPAAGRSLSVAWCSINLVHQAPAGGSRGSSSGHRPTVVPLLMLLR